MALCARMLGLFVIVAVNSVEGFTLHSTAIAARTRGSNTCSGSTCRNAGHLARTRATMQFGGGSGPMSMDSSDPFAAATIRAQRINYAFIAACIPGILPYQEAVNTFVSTIISCLDDGVSIGALDLTLAQTQSTGNEQMDMQLGFTTGRQFAAEEVALRRQWILFVYAAALAVGSHTPTLTGLGDVVATRYVRHLHENFYAKGQKDLKSINLEMTFVTAGTDEAAKTPTEKAMLSQAARFALTAFDLLSPKSKA